VTSIDETTSDLSRLAGTWVLDPGETSVTFRTKAMWIVPVEGTAKALSGDAQVGPDASASGTLVIDATSFDTKNKRRDAHLRSRTFLEVDKYPTIVFTATGGGAAGAGRIEISGVLTVHGRNQPLTLQAEVNESATSASLSSEVEIDRRLWGVSWGGQMGVGLKVRVAIRAHFDRA
jgi:polyisoprenoid-binding protein YceI